MKKTLTTLAALAAASAASAQSSVTMFGVIDAGVSYYQTTSKDTGGALRYRHISVLDTEMLRQMASSD